MKPHGFGAKGVIDIEFIMAAFLFLGSLSFTMLAIGREFLSFREAAISENYNMEVKNILQLMMFDEGEPADWDAGEIADVKRLGLSSGEKFILDLEKINRLQSLCSRTNPDYEKNYNKVKSLLGVKGDIILDINDVGGAPFLSCRPGVETLSSPKFSSEGYGVVIAGGNKNIVRLSVTVIA